MPPLSATQLLDQYYLNMRSALIETAAGFDRIQRADTDGTGMADERLAALRSICEVILSSESDRARRALETLSNEDAS